jgi:hypothetical protein
MFDVFPLIIVPADRFLAVPYFRFIPITACCQQIKAAEAACFSPTPQNYP